MKIEISYFRIAIVITLLTAIFGANLTALAQSPTNADTKIINVASGTYIDDEGTEFTAVSPEVVVEVVSISAIVVTPDQTGPSEVVAPNDTITRAFKACNTSNITDSYTITAATTDSPASISKMYIDLDDNGEVTSADEEINVNQALSQQIEPGSCFTILVVVETNDISPGSQLEIAINVRSNDTSSVNGQVEDSGKIVNTAGKNADFSHPEDPTLLPQKLVQNEASYVSGKNEQLEYLITFKNSGDVPARNVVMSDDLPEELSYVPGTLKVNDISVSDADDADQGFVAGQQIIVRFAEDLVPHDVVRVSFKAIISGDVSPGRGIVNIAKITADNASAEDTTAASAVVDPFGTVYAARGGASHPIPGAQVGIFPDENSNTPISIPAGQGFSPNFENTNPYVTNDQGRYSFAFARDQLGTLTQEASYVIRVTAEGFKDRLIRVLLSPDAHGLFKMTVQSLDGMPVAVANGFELTSQDVFIASIAEIAFNIPMFEDSLLYVNKTVDRTVAEAGDILSYRIDGKNTSIIGLQSAIVRDVLPNAFSYAEGTARLIKDGITTEINPTVSGQNMSFDLGSLESGESFEITYRVRIGANAKKGDNYNSAVIDGVFPSGEEISSPESRALVKVGQGVFSMRQFIIGKVYVDANNNYRFDEGETPVAGARIFLANGDSATTDSQGLYSIPAVSQGSQLVSLDPITLPEGLVLADGERRAHEDWTRLLRTPLGGGGMLRQNFVLIEDARSPSEITSTTKISDKTNEVIEEELPETIEEAVVEYKELAPGELDLHNFENESVVLSNSQSLQISAAEDWAINLKVNDQVYGSDSIGATRNDPKNKIVTYTYVGVGFKPGPNKVAIETTGPNGEAGKREVVTVYGRGLPTQLKIAADKRELEASGRDSTTIYVRAYDKWGNPAQDGSISVTTTGGHLLGKNKKLADVVNRYHSDLDETEGQTSEQVANTTQEQAVLLRNGIGKIKIISDNKTGIVKIRAKSGKFEQEYDLRFTSEKRPQFLSGLAEVTIGKNAPDMINRGVDETVRGRIQVFYKGSLLSDKNLLTVAYDSQEALNRISGQDRLFQLNPLDHVYPLFGDNSTRYKETASNSKVYARLDRGRSYAMFGDFQTGLESSRLLGYSRNLTGGKVHIENSNGDQIIVTGARPDTSFARQVIPGGSFGLVQLAYPEILPGSEVLALETRDRRNPELIIKREVLSRSVDYNLDTTTGTIFFLRPIPTFDRELNLVQVVATYEYRSNGNESAVYTARGVKQFESLGLKLGFSFINQQQGDSKPYRLGGADVALRLPNDGLLEFEWARSRGELNNGFSFIGNRPSSNNEFNGDAFFLNVEQPLSGRETILRFNGFSASRNFYNPFGATITPGTSRGTVSVETSAVKNATVRANFVAEKNLTDNVDNNRITAGVKWTQNVNDKLSFTAGYDFRRFTDNLSDRQVSANLISIGANYQPTDKLEFAIKREQNLGEEDPSFPTQTLISANYMFRDDTKLFFTQRLSARPITPIADVTGTGFAVSSARNETAIGVETQLGKYTSLSGRYQLENGVNGTDSFSIIGLQNRLPIGKAFSLEVGYERAFHIKGDGSSYNNFVLGGNWVPDENFRTSFRYELRDRDGFGQLFSLGAAGKIKPGWTTMGRFQYGDIDYNGRRNEVMNGELALAIRPHNTDRYGILLSYKHRENLFSSGTETTPTELRSDLFSVDGFHQTTSRLEFYGKFAAKYQSDRTPSVPFANNLNYLAQGRAQYMLTNWLDVAAEGRFTYSPYSGGSSRWLGVEGGYWATPDLRIAGGYNFSTMNDAYGFNDNGVFNRGGFYISVSTKISKFFNLFGTSEEGLEMDMDREIRRDTARVEPKK